MPPRVPGPLTPPAGARRRPGRPTPRRHHARALPAPPGRAARAVVVRISPGPTGVVLAAALLLTGSGALGAVRQAVLAQPASRVTRTAGAQPTPVPPVALPAAVENPSPYLQQISCHPVDMPGATRLGNLLRATYPGTSYGISRACGSDGIASEHYEGRAVDWMISSRDPAQAFRAQALLDWLLRPDASGRPFANARRLGVMYLIWKDRIWGSYRASEGWRPYSTCAQHPERSYDTACHRDHVHISLSWAGAAGRTSFWTGRVAPTDYGPCRPADLNWAPPYTGPRLTPCPNYPPVPAPAGSPAAVVALVKASGAQLGPGATGPLVRAVQRVLGVAGDGSFGPLTGGAVSAFRMSHGLRAGQALDPATWRALLAAFAKAGPAPKPAPAPPPGTAGGVTAGALAAYGGQVLRYGQSGAAVKVVQQLLGVPSTGWFGPLTLAAVRAFQQAHAIPPTGNVGPLTWGQLSRLVAASARHR